MSHGSDGSTKTVLTAVAGNTLVTIAKFIGFAVSGSSALLAEAVHSLADTANQALLYLGLRRSIRQADEEHHFGYGQERYFWNLVSAVTIFFLGCVYTVMHAIQGLSDGNAPELSWTPFVIVGFAFLVEGYSFGVALVEFRRQSREAGKSFRQYFVETRDPSTLAVLIEDSVAVLGLLLALAGMGLAAATGSALFDGIAAILIGLLMGCLAIFLAAMNRKYLLNRSDDEVNEVAARLWSEDQRVQSVESVYSIVLSPEESLMMAELELREEAIFSDMSREEIARAIRFMRTLNEIRTSLEEDVRRVVPEAGHIFIEFMTPETPERRENPDKA